MTTDAMGRLWVATADFRDQGADAIYLVSGVGATPTKVISGLHTPLGLVWDGGSLYVSSAARVDAYSGFDGRTFAVRRTVVTFPAGIGEVNGLVLGTDGRFRLGISAPCDACTPTSPESGTIVSFLPDGSGLRVEASGIRAPVGLAYDAGSGDLFVTMNQRDDLGATTPGDWLAVVRNGQSWGFPSCYGQGSVACANVPRPVAVLDPHAAVSGVAIVRGLLGTPSGTSAVVAEWAIGKVVVIGLTRDGTSWQGTAGILLSGVTQPVAVLAAANGLFVGDWATGTIYRIASA
jgi:glucose/arabinose dehydrogenase